MKWTFAVALLIGCGGGMSSGGDTPRIDGDTCALHLDETSCRDNTCEWFALGQPCQVGQPCVSGECQSPTTVGSGSTGSGSTSTGCACPNGGVCFEQIGGPAMQAGSGPEVQCTTPTAGDGDACTRIQGEGTCTESAAVTGLCVCDNGER